MFMLKMRIKGFWRIIRKKHQGIIDTIIKEAAQVNIDPEPLFQNL